MMRCALFVAVAALVSCGGYASSAPSGPNPEKPPQDEINVDVVTCDLEDNKPGSGCSYLCICQKILWAVDYNHPLMPGQPTDVICQTWREEKKISDNCEIPCFTIAQHIDAAAGGDPMVCLKASAEANKLEQVSKEFFFKETSTTLRKVDKAKKEAAGSKRAAKKKLDIAALAKHYRFRVPSFPPPADLVPKTWLKGPRYPQEARRDGAAVPASATAARTPRRHH